MKHKRKFQSTKEVMTKKVVFIDGMATAKEAVDLMKAENIEALIAHEIAHQWFGNSASENDWNHVWLSEGFATYFTILYMEHYYGDQKRKEELRKDREEIIAYYMKNPSPVVDPTIKDSCIAEPTKINLFDDLSPSLPSKNLRNDLIIFFIILKNLLLNLALLQVLLLHLVQHSLHQVKYLH